MSLKTIWLEQGTLRVNASHHAARRTSHPRRDAGVPLRQQLAQFRRSWPRPDLRPSRTRLAHPKIPRLDQEGERHRAPLSRQNQRTQRGPNHSLDRPLARLRRHPAASFTAPPVPDSLHAPISSCWPKSMAPTKASPPQPCAAYYSANTKSTAWPNTKAWPRSRPPTSTTCGAPGPIAKSASITPRPAPRG